MHVMYIMYVSIVYGTVDFSEILHLAFLFSPLLGEMIHFD